MIPALRYLGQAAAYALFAAFIGYFAAAPAYTYRPPDMAEIKLSFSHGGQRKGGCRPLSAEEIAKLPPNMRRTQACPRERVPVLVEMEADGRLLYRDLLPPSGLASDGPSRAYRRFALAPGAHRLELRLRDSERASGFDYQRIIDVELRPRQNLVVDFRPEAGGFVVR
jgi:hypothetical protein